MTVEALKPKPDADVIRFLEEALEMARTGELQQVAIVIGEPGERCRVWRVGKVGEIVLALECAKHVILTEWLGGHSEASK